MGDAKREARARWLQGPGADLAAQWPGRTGACPMCGADAAFNRHPRNPQKWVCHSTTHNTVQAGRQKDNVWWGDALDLESHLRGASDTDVLRQDGYLEDRPVSASERQAWAREQAARERAGRARQAQGWRHLEGLRNKIRNPDNWTGRSLDGGDSLQITVFRPDVGRQRPTHTINPGEPKDTTWRALARTIQEPRAVPSVPHGCVGSFASPKFWLPGWCGSRFQGHRRGKDSIIDSGALLIDLDSDPTAEGVKRGAPDLGPDELSRMVGEVAPGVAFLAHTTPSSRPGAWRWRLVLPLARRVNASEYTKICGVVRLSALLQQWGAPFEADKSWSSPTRYFYAPARFPDYRFTIHPGQYLDPDVVLRMLHV